MTVLFHISCLPHLVLRSTCGCVPAGVLKGKQRRNITMATSPTWLLGRKTTLLSVFFTKHTDLLPPLSWQAKPICHITTTKRFNRWSGASGYWQLEARASEGYSSVSETNVQTVSKVWGRDRDMALIVWQRMSIMILQSENGLVIAHMTCQTTPFSQSSTTRLIQYRWLQISGKLLRRWKDCLCQTFAVVGNV